MDSNPQAEAAEFPGVDPLRLRAVRLATAGFYLSRLLMEQPDSEMIRRFTGDMSKTWPLDDPESRAALELIEESADSHWEIGEDYQNLFVHIAVPVLETDGDFVVGDSGSLASLYSEHKFTPAQGGRAPLAHIGIKLGFLASLATRATDVETCAAIESFRESRFDAHAAAVLDAIGKNAQTGTYQGIARLTSSMLVQLGQHTAGVLES